MQWWSWLLVGIVLGANLGVLLAGLAVSAARGRTG